MEQVISTVGMVIRVQAGGMSMTAYDGWGLRSVLELQSNLNRLEVSTAFGASGPWYACMVNLPNAGVADMVKLIQLVLEHWPALVGGLSMKQKPNLRAMALNEELTRLIEELID